MEVIDLVPQIPHDSPSSSGCPDNSTPRRLRVGCALLPKKVSRYLTSSIKAIALSQGVELSLIDYGRSLHEQGPFDAIIHKLRPNPDWERNLLDYSKQHPGVAVIDRVDGIRTLQNRSTMLTPLHGEGVVIKDGHGDYSSARVQAPNQVEIAEGTSLAEAERMLAAAGLQPPLLVKPLWTDGREGSHGLAVLHDLASLEQILTGEISSDLQPPLVVQQFVEHGGVLFKIYVLGDRTVVSKRPSLGDKYLGHEARKQGVLQLPRISCKSSYNPTGANSQGSHGQVPAIHIPTPVSPHTAAAATPAATEQPGLNCCIKAPPALPPDWVTHALARVLRERLGLQLFNFDLICPEEQLSEDECLYYVIDINYFPGVDKIPNFEHVFISFLKSAVLHHPAHAESGEEGAVVSTAQTTSDRSSQASCHTDKVLAA